MRRKQCKLNTCFISSSRIKAFSKHVANERARIPGQYFAQTMIKTSRTKLEFGTKRCICLITQGIWRSLIQY